VGRAEELDLTGDRPQRSGHRQQCCRLAGTVATQERDDLARGDVNVEVTDDRHVAVAGVHVLGLEHGAHVKTFPRSASLTSPRNAAITPRSDSARSGGPSAITFPKSSATIRSDTRLT